jgi:hypothetical protein
MAKKSYDGEYASHRETNQSGYQTNAIQSMPNGMEFTKPEVEQVFTARQEQHWRDEDGVNALPVPMDFHYDWEMQQRVEESRFLHHMTTGKKK